MRLFCDWPVAYATGFQDPATNWMFAIIDLHDRIMFFLFILLTVVMWFLISGQTNPDHLSHLRHGDTIEQIWTITPAIILWAIGLPSLRLLYMMDEVLDAEITVKCIGSQWFWSYEQTDYANPISFDSFMLDEASQELGDQRQLTVDNAQVQPVATSVRIQISSNDVIHSFAVPSQAQKCDALPGRLNSIGVVINRPGTYYGQCSELCGYAHGMMPITIKGVSIPEYLTWLESNL